MKVASIVFLFLIAPFWGVQPVSAQDSTVVQSDYKNKVLLLPVIGSSPETGFMFGALVVPQFKIGTTDQETRSSSVMTSAIYTTKSQILLSILPDIILAGETWMLKGNYFVNYFPESYWGVGPLTKDSDELTTLYTQIHLEQNALRKVRQGFFAGPYLRWSKLYNLKFENTEGERVAIPEDIDANKNIAAGIGWITRWDRRNSNMTPTNNHYVQFSVLANPSWLGSSRSFTLYELDARKYVPLSSNNHSIIAVQGLFQLNSGHPPFNDLGMIGGDRINRGYYNGRYRDQNSAQLQAELRQHAVGRFGFTVFAGTGEVWNRFDAISLQNYKWTAGAGLRFNINKDDPTNIRVDFGVSKESVGFYLQFGEAF